MRVRFESDGSVVVDLAKHVVVLCARSRAIHLRARPRGVDKGAILGSFPLAAVERVRLRRAGSNGGYAVSLAFRSGTCLELGRAPSDDAMALARQIAKLTRCMVEVRQGSVAALPGPSARFSEEVDTLDQVLGPNTALYGPSEAPTMLDARHTPVFDSHDSTDPG